MADAHNLVLQTDYRIIPAVTKESPPAEKEAPPAQKTP
jgi:hypothetical protein